MFNLVDGSNEQALDGSRPCRALVSQLYGDPHEELERRLYTAVFAKEPTKSPVAQITQEMYLAGWQRALARGSRSTEDSVLIEQRDPQKAAAQRASLGRVGVVVLGRGAAFTVPGDILDGAYARNFRSYWSESLVFALLQHDRLEYLAGELAELGFDPSAESLDRLYDEWLAFRNVFWWSQLSTATDVPQKLVALLRAEYGTERLFSDLEADFATYTARRRWRMEDDQARALANLQTYGAAVAVIGSLATIAALLHPSGALLAASVFIVLATGVGAAFFVRSRLPSQRPSPAPSQVDEARQRDS
jgi:multisubunit Na+/H+ antiporter MnhG subunit